MTDSAENEMTILKSVRKYQNEEEFTQRKSGIDFLQSNFEEQELELIFNTLLKKGYYLGQFLCKGGEGKIFKGTYIDRGIRQECAFKILKDCDANELYEEIHIMNKFKHSHNIIKLIDFIKVSQNLQVIVLEKCERSLKDLLDEMKYISSPFKLKDLFQILFNLFEALIEIHQNRIIHCDIKPGNILMNKQGKFVLTDFGLSFLKGSTQIKGFTMSYASPEQQQLKSELIGYKSDIYSLGKTIIQIIDVFQRVNKKYDIIQEFEKEILEKMLEQEIDEREDAIVCHQKLIQMFLNERNKKYHNIIFTYSKKIEQICQSIPFEIDKFNPLLKVKLFYLKVNLQIKVFQLLTLQKIGDEKEQFQDKERIFEILEAPNYQQRLDNLDRYGTTQFLYFPYLKSREMILKGIRHEIADSLNKIGQCYKVIGDLEIDLNDQLLLKNLALSLKYVGMCYPKLSDYKNALNYQLNSLRMYRELFKGNHPNIAQSLRSVGSCFEVIGDTKNYLKYELDSLSMYRKLFKGNHPDIAQSLRSVGRCYKGIGDTESYLKYEFDSLVMKMELFRRKGSNITESLNNSYEKFENNHLNSLKMITEIFKGKHPHVQDFLYSRIISSHSQQKPEEQQNIKNQDQVLLNSTFQNQVQNTFQNKKESEREQISVLSLIKFQRFILDLCIHLITISDTKPDRIKIGNNSRITLTDIEDQQKSQCLLTQELENKILSEMYTNKLFERKYCGELHEQVLPQQQLLQKKEQEIQSSQQEKQQDSNNLQQVLKQEQENEEDLGNKIKVISRTNINLGKCNSNERDWSQPLKYPQKSLEINKERHKENNNIETASSVNNSISNFFQMNRLFLYDNDDTIKKGTNQPKIQIKEIIILGQDNLKLKQQRLLNQECQNNSSKIESQSQTPANSIETKSDEVISQDVQSKEYSDQSIYLSKREMQPLAEIKQKQEDDQQELIKQHFTQNKQIGNIIEEDINNLNIKLKSYNCIITKFLAKDEKRMVFEGTLDQKNNNREVIFKVYNYSEDKDETESELLIMKKFDINIIKLIKWIRLEKNYVLIFEKCKYSLKNELQLLQEDNNLKFSENKLFHMFMDLLDGFLQMSQLRIFHLDIKPDNILISEDGNYLYSDFGISSKFIQEKAKGYSRKYAAEEQINQIKIDQLSNIYSLGKTFQEIVAVYRLRIKNKSDSEFIFSIENIIQQKMIEYNDRNDYQELHQLFFEVFIDSNKSQEFKIQYEQKINDFINKNYLDNQDLPFNLDLILYYLNLKLKLNLSQQNHPKVSFELYSQLAYHYQLTGQYNQSLKYSLHALDISSKFLFGDQLNISLLLMLATLYLQIGDLDIGLVYSFESLKISRSFFNEDHLYIAESLYYVGVNYGLLGDSKNALKYFFESLEMCERLFKGDHPHIATSLSNVGVSYSQLGDSKNALKHSLQSLEMIKQIFSGDHLDIGTSLSNVGVSYSLLGDSKNALEYFLQSLEIYKRFFKGDHPHIATSLYNMSQFYSVLGYSYIGLKYFHQSLEMYKRLFKGDHPLIAPNIGQFYSELGGSKNTLNTLFNLWK